MAMTVLRVQVPMMATVLEASEGMQMNLHIGDKVRVGTRVGTITDVGTILIEVKATDGSVRMVCPWELVRTRGR